MQFGFPFLDVLTIPTDAGPGDPRVVITGDPPKILVQSPSGSYVQLIPGASDAEINLNPPDFLGHALTVGRVIADVDEARELPFILVASPTIDGLEDLRLFIQGEAGDGTRPTLNVDSGAASGVIPRADILLDGKAIGAGVLENGIFRSTGNDSARAAGADTDMTVTVPQKQFHWYRASLHCSYTTGGANVACVLERDGTEIGLLDFVFAAGDGVFNAFCEFEHTTADDETVAFTVANSGGSGGTLQLRSDNSRTFSVIDLGNNS